MPESTTTPETLPRVAVLPEVVQNKIAAGEVVERPSSAVKELAENALDAGAGQITIEIEEGGRRLIRVIDDGCGMNETDLALAVQRHATSKIRDVEDIFAIHSMGFRGEALPSIGSVSRLTIRTAPADAESGHELAIEAGHTQRLAPCAPRRGTVVEVRELFHNTPARLKFMKSASAEVAAIGECITRLALAHPTVGFRMINDGRTAIDLPRHSSAAERIGALFGRTLLPNLLAVQHDGHEGIVIEGFVARPPESRANSRTIYTFINGRWFRHAGLARVIRDAYQGALPPRRYPFGVLYITLDPARVDVNVHPTKEEVRFDNDRLVVGSVRRAVQNTLEDSTGRPPRPESVSPSGPESQPTNDALAADDDPSMMPASGSAESPSASPSLPTQAAEAGVLYAPAPTTTGRTEPSTPARAATPPPAPSPAEQHRLPMDQPARHKVIGQAGGRYVVVESPEGIVLVDQHALHERWNYERLRNREQPVTSQRLLVPIVVELSPREAAIFDDALPVLREAGFELESFGVATLSVSAVPEIVKLNAIERIIRDVFTEVEQGATGKAMGDLRDRLLASLACRSAVLFGTHLPHQALVALMDKFHEARQPLTCPHGRPTTFTLTWDELQRRFGRA